MAEVSVNQEGKITVHKMVCTLDCGTAVYPDAIRAQAEAGVVMGLSAAFHEKVRFENGGVKTTNYDDYPVLTMSEVPEIEVHIARNTLTPGGVGEPVFPSVAPAVANALFKGTGVRLRELPFKRELLINKGTRKRPLTNMAESFAGIDAVERLYYCLPGWKAS
jgi:isoquinoline 1-oxidoreductase beta subunit